MLLFAELPILAHSMHMTCNPEHTEEFTELIVDNQNGVIIISLVRYIPV